MFERAMTAEFINAVANHPDVRPSLLGSKKIDYTPLVSDLNNVVLQGRFGGIVFHKIMPSLYECHTQFLSEGRGEWGLNFARESGFWMFTNTDAAEIITRVPKGNVAARALVMSVGGVLETTQSIEFEKDIVTWGVYRQTTQDWIRTSPLLEDVGHRFFEEVDRQADEKGLDVPDWGDDPFRNRHTGAAISMLLGGQIAKGVGFYNRFCSMAISPLASLVSLDPVVVNFAGVVLKIENHDFQLMESVPCRQQ